MKKNKRLIALINKIRKQLHYGDYIKIAEATGEPKRYVEKFFENQLNYVRDERRIKLIGAAAELIKNRKDVEKNIQKQLGNI